MTAIFWLLVLGLVIYEVWALTNRRQGDTISEIVWRLARRPIVPFLFGLLMGHFFWGPGP